MAPAISVNNLEDPEHDPPREFQGLLRLFAFTYVCRGRSVIASFSLSRAFAANIRFVQLALTHFRRHVQPEHGEGGVAIAVYIASLRL